MATDSKLATGASVADTGTSLYLSLAYSLPILLWMSAHAGLSQQGSLLPVEVASQGARILFLVQALLVTIVAPWYSRHGAWRMDLLALLSLVLLPLPLVSILWLTGAVPASALLLAQSAVLCLCMLLFVLYRLLAALLPGALAGVLLVSAVQVLGVSGLWAWRATWLTWAGL